MIEYDFDQFSKFLLGKSYPDAGGHVSLFEIAITRTCVCRKALQYTVGEGRANKQWTTGQGLIRSKHIRPAWQPTPQNKREKPGIPDVIPEGSPKNPMALQHWF